MAVPEHPTFSVGDVTIRLKPTEVYLEITIKNQTFRLSDQEARWLKDFLNSNYPTH